MDQDFSQAVTRDIGRWPRVEIAVEERGAGQNLRDGDAGGFLYA
jgi:hypothetical protein